VYHSCIRTIARVSTFVNIAGGTIKQGATSRQTRLVGLRLNVEQRAIADGFRSSRFYSWVLVLLELKLDGLSYAPQVADRLMDVGHVGAQSRERRSFGNMDAVTSDFYASHVVTRHDLIRLSLWLSEFERARGTRRNRNLVAPPPAFDWTEGTLGGAGRRDRQQAEPARGRHCGVLRSFRLLWA